MRYVLSLIMAIFPSLAGDMPWDRIPSLSPGMELLHSVAIPAQAQVKNNTVYIEQVSVEDYYKMEDKANEEILSAYYSERR